MSKILKANYVQTEISIFKDGGISSVTFNPGNSADILFKSGKKIKTGCINCINPKCLSVSDDDIECADFPDIAHDMSKYLCPVNAIRSGSDHIVIDSSKCVGCGLCVSSCPVGAIFLRDGKAVVACADKKDLESLSVDATGIKEQELFLKENDSIKKKGIIQKEGFYFRKGIYI